MNPKAIEKTLERFGEAIRDLSYTRLDLTDGRRDTEARVTLNNIDFFRNRIWLPAPEREGEFLFSSRKFWSRAKIPEIFLGFLIRLDPTPKSIYTKWILRMWLAGKTGSELLEDLPKITNDLLIFHTVKNQLPIELRNIDTYKSFDDLLRVVNEVPAVAVSKRAAERNEEQGFIESGEAEIMYSDDELKIIIPKSEAAAIHFGRNTRWCTAAASSWNAFERYHSEGNLYIILFKKTNIRWQFHFETGQLMDAEDRQLESRVIQESIAYDHFDWDEIVRKNAHLVLVHKKPNKQLRLHALRGYPDYINRIPNPSEEELRMAISTKPSLLVKLKGCLRRDDLRLLAIERDPNVIEQLPALSRDEAWKAVAYRGDTLRFVPHDLIDYDLAVEAMRSYTHEISEYNDRRLQLFARGTSRTKKVLEPIYYVPVHLIDDKLIALHYAAQRSDIELSDFPFVSGMEENIQHPESFDAIEQLRRLMSMLERQQYRQMRYVRSDVEHDHLSRRLFENYDKAMKKIRDRKIRYDYIDLNSFSFL